jgi:hypothetical protein
MFIILALSQMIYWSIYIKIYVCALFKKTISFNGIAGPALRWNKSRIFS